MSRAWEARWPPGDRSHLAWLAWLAVVLLSAIVIARGWLCDDAFITLRTVDNFVSGLGLRWNPAERVQSYTHPLWFFLLSAPYALTREPFYTTLVVSFVVAVVGLVLFARRVATTPAAAIAGLAAFGLSAAWVDFCTSGLENPLSHLLILVLLMEVRPRACSPRIASLRLALVFSLLLLCRLDLVFVGAPLAIAGILAHARGAQGRGRDVAVGVAGGVAIGSLPIVLWEAFSIVYYGTPLPNTAHAKLFTGIGAGERIAQGARYLLESLLSDPITLVTIALGIAVALRRRSRVTLAAAAGLAAALAYVVWVGGDFMGGRLLTPAFVLAVGVLTGTAWPVTAGLFPVKATPWLAAAVFAAVLVPRSAGLDARWWLAPDGIGYAGIVNERDMYAPALGIGRDLRGESPVHPAEIDGRRLRAAGPQRVVVRAAVGLVGYYAGPGVHVIDVLALCDPLLARLPAHPGSRVGHFVRPLPPGYEDSLKTGTNQIADPAIARLYDDVSQLARGPLWTRARWRAIARLSGISSL